MNKAFMLLLLSSSLISSMEKDNFCKEEPFFETDEEIENIDQTFVIHMTLKDLNRQAFYQAQELRRIRQMRVANIKQIKQNLKKR